MFRLFGSGRDIEVLGSINGITLTREDIAKFGDVVHDNSPIHRNADDARQHGFDDTPVIGVHLAAIGGRISRNLLAIMQTPDKMSYYTRQEVTFRDPVYPNEPINWTIADEIIDDTMRSYRLMVPSSNPSAKPRVELTSVFSTAKPEFQRRGISKLVYQEKVKIVPHEVEEFYHCLKESPLKDVAFSHGVAIIPSTLLSFLAELNKLSGTEIGGKNISMGSQMYEDLEVGDGIVEVYQVAKKGRGEKVFYTFDGVLYQNGTARISSEVKTLTNGELNTEALRSRWGLTED